MSYKDYYYNLTAPIIGTTPTLAGILDISTDQMILNDREYRAAIKRIIWKAKLDSFSDDAKNALPGAVIFMGQVFNAFNNGHTADDILADTRRVNQSIGGVGYQTYGNIDSAGSMKELHRSNVNNTLDLMASGAGVGSTFGPIGAAAGAAVGGIVGLISGGRRHAEEREMLADAQTKANRYNMYNRSVAATLAAQADFRNMYGNYENRPLHAANGMEPAYASAGEVKYNPNDSYASGIIPGSRAQGDWIPTIVDDDTTIFTEQFNFAQRALPEVMKIKAIDHAIDSVKGKSAKEVTKNVLAKERNAAEQNLEMLAQEQHETMEPIRLAEDGVQHAANGLELGNLLTSLTGGLIGLGQYFGARNQRVKSPQTYVPNTQANRAFDLLSGLRISEKPILGQINREAAAGRYRLASAGGLSGAQKYLGNIAMTANTQTAKAQAMQNLQAQNNAYLSTEAQARLTSGAQEAQNQIATNQWDLDYYSKAHAARQQGMQVGLYNLLNQLQQYTANANMLKMFDKMYNLYYQELNSRD